MTTSEVTVSEGMAAPPALPDYLASPNAVLGDTDVQWRYGRAPDYSKTRGVWAQSKKANHAAGSLPELVENLVKNWEVEASFKTKLSDWRTVDHENYTFAINGGPPQSGEHMLRVGTYNAIIAPNEYYSPANSDFASSHKTFKRMMPTFAWEVIEVYSGPPRVSFKWRHWGTMKNDYVGFNDKGEKVTAKAHGGVIDILGITIATVDDKVRLQAVDTYFDPLDMFRQIAPAGIVNKQAVDKKVFDADTSADHDKPTPVPINADGHVGREHGKHDDSTHAKEHLPLSNSSDVFHDALSEASNGTSTYGVPEATSEAEWATSTDTEDDMADSGSESVVQNHKSTEADSAGAAAESATLKTRDAKHMAEQDSCSMAGKLTSVDSTQSTCPVTGGSRVSSRSAGSERELSSFPSSEGDGSLPPRPASESGNAGEDQRLDDTAIAELRDAVDNDVGLTTGSVDPHPPTVDEVVKPQPGEAVAVEPHTKETIMTYEEMSRITPAECPFLMNRE